MEGMEVLTASPRALNARKTVLELILSDHPNDCLQCVPLFLNAEMLAQVLGVSQATAYELLHEESFPKLKIGNRIVIPKDRFIEWVSVNTKGGCV